MSALLASHSSAPPPHAALHLRLPLVPPVAHRTLGERAKLVDGLLCHTSPLALAPPPSAPVTSPSVNCLTPPGATCLMMRWAQWVTRPSSLTLATPARCASTLLWGAPPPHRPLQHPPSNLCCWVSLRGLVGSAPALGRREAGERGRGRGSGGGRGGGRGASAGRGRGRTPLAAPRSTVTRSGGDDRFNSSDPPREGARKPHGGCQWNVPAEGDPGGSYRPSRMCRTSDHVTSRPDLLRICRVVELSDPRLKTPY